jgi:hypothetical protein
LALKEEIDKISSCIEPIKQIANQHKTEIDYCLAAVMEEADAKTRAQEELVIPQVRKLNKQYKTQIRNRNKTFDKEIRKLQTKRRRTEKFVEKSKEKISLYKTETEWQASRGHLYAKRWRKKFTRMERELIRYEKKLESIESDLGRMTNRKEIEISELNHELNTKIQIVRQPLFEIETNRTNKINGLRQKTQQLFDLENDLIKGLNKIAQIWDFEKGLENLSLQGRKLANPVLVYVPFYLICFQSIQNKRFLLISPSFFGSVDFSAKFKGVFGITKLKNLLNPRFQTMTLLIQKVQEPARQDAEFESQLLKSAQKQNLLKNDKFKKNALEGLVFLKNEGWLSDKEQQSLSRQLS